MTFGALAYLNVKATNKENDIQLCKMGGENSDACVYSFFEESNIWRQLNDTWKLPFSVEFGNFGCLNYVGVFFHFFQKIKANENMQSQN